MVLIIQTDSSLSKGQAPGWSGFLAGVWLEKLNAAPASVGPVSSELTDTCPLQQVPSQAPVTEAV